MTRKDKLRIVAEIYFVLAAASNLYYFTESMRSALGVTAGALFFIWLRATWHEVRKTE